jgi:chromate transporter
MPGAPRQEPSPFGPGNPEQPSLRYLFLRFLRYGFLAWGGPVAQIGLMHREVVERDRWVPEDKFRKTLALYQALPGPEAHELAVYFGMVKARRRGGLATGLGFMLPGVVLVTLVAAAYAALGEGLLATLEPALRGFRPAVVALVAMALLRLGKASLRTSLHAAIAVGAALAASLLGVNFLLVLLAGGAAALAVGRARTRRGLAGPGLALALAGATFPVAGATGMLALAEVMAKVGLLTFGGAYTAIPFLQEGAVRQHGWITDAQFLDALALAALVPGPLVAVGTFVGYLAAGLPGAVLATVLIFGPAFLFTLLGHDLFERLVHEPRLHAFLLGVTAAVIGLVAAATLPLARAAFPNAVAVLLGVLALVALLGGRVPIPLVLAGAGAAGVAAAALGL